MIREVASRGVDTRDPAPAVAEAALPSTAAHMVGSSSPTPVRCPAPIGLQPKQLDGPEQLSRFLASINLG